MESYMGFIYKIFYKCKHQKLNLMLLLVLQQTVQHSGQWPTIYQKNVSKAQCRLHTLQSSLQKSFVGDFVE